MDEVLDDRKPKTQAIVLHHVTRALAEWLKDQREKFRRYADTGVADGELDCGPGLTESHDDATTRWREFNGVDDKIFRPKQSSYPQ